MAEGERYLVYIDFPNWFLAQSAYWTANLTRWSWQWLFDQYQIKINNMYVEGNSLVLDIDPPLPIAIIVAIIIAAGFAVGLIGIRIISYYENVEKAKITSDKLTQIIQDPNVPIELKEKALEKLGQIPTQQDMFSQITQLIFIFIVFMLILKLIEKI